METLVLTQGYQPLARIPWQRAVTLLFLGKVETVDEYDREIRSPSQALKVPSVVRFLRTFRRRKKAVKFSRENVYLRDKGRCQYCQEAIERRDATYDHVLPRSKGGETDWHNIVISCVPCNQKKANRTPEQANMRLDTPPMRPKVLPHNPFGIHWRDDMPESWRDFLSWVQR